MVTRALAFVTLTPRALALARMSTRLREETALAILLFVSKNKKMVRVSKNVLSGVGAVVHEEELNVLGVVDEESLVTRGHQVAGLLVATITDLTLLLDMIPILAKICSNVPRAWQWCP